MYSPQYALETDRDKIDPVIKENPFATLVYQDQNKVQSFHLPLLLKENRLVGHMALANSAWKALDGSSVLSIFHGPHCYISPVWYGSPRNVPTWNYISIQVRGEVQIRNDESFLHEVLSELSRKYDPTFNIETNIHEHLDLLKGIVGIEITITDVVAKFKLAQSKPMHERLNVIHKLEKSSKSADLDVAKAMRKTLR